MRIGTSGWAYDGWRGPLYPEKLPKKEWLRSYASRFVTAEINGSFYRTPSLEAVKAWREQTPRDFLFAWKASKFITHWKRLTANCEKSIALMETRLRVLGPKAGVVLFQLPQRFRKDAGRLRDFLNMPPRRHRYAFEFRDAAWHAPDVYNALHAFDVALCISDHADAPAPWEVTARHVYVRGHGPSGRYKGNYSDRTRQRPKSGGAARCAAPHRTIAIGQSPRARSPGKRSLIEFPAIAGNRSQRQRLSETRSASLW